jgi:hypothetical protein
MVRRLLPHSDVSLVRRIDPDVALTGSVPFCGVRLLSRNAHLASRAIIDDFLSLPLPAIGTTFSSCRHSTRTASMAQLPPQDY